MKVASDKAHMMAGGEEEVAAEPRFWTDLKDLTKARLTGLVLVTTFVGFVLGSPGGLSWLLLLQTLAGTALVAVSSSIFNQSIEIRPDSLMKRTRNRPLVAGRFNRMVAHLAGAATALLGVGWLWWAAGFWAALVAGLTWFIYVVIYTPMKRFSSACTLVGAVAGALPPLVGWVAAGASEPLMGVALFGILFFWQLPHFLAINWLYREDYEQAGFVMWSNGDASGRRTSFLAVIFSLCLIAFSLLPWATLQWWGSVALLIAGGAMAVLAMRFRKQPTPGTARALFFYTLAYLPLALGILMVARS